MTFPEVPLKRFGRVVGGATPKSSDANWNGDITWYTPTDVSPVHGGELGDSARTITQQGLASISAQVIPAGSLVFTSRAPIGNVALTRRSAVTNQGCKTLIPAFDVDVRFVMYAALVRCDHMKAVGTGTTFQEVSAERLGGVRFPKPPLETQSAIADFLDRECARIDELMAELNGAVDLCAEWLASSLRELLRVGSGEMPFGRYAALQRGFDLASDSRRHGDARVLGSGGPIGVHDETRTAAPAVVTGRYGSIGVVTWSDLPVWPLNTTLFVSDFKGNDPRFVYWALRSLPLRQEAAKSAVPGLHRADVHRLTIGRFDVDLQQRIARSLDIKAQGFDLLTSEIAGQQRLMCDYRDALITEAVTGKLDVSDASDARMSDNLAAVREGADPEVLA